MTKRFVIAMGVGLALCVLVSGVVSKRAERGGERSPPAQVSAADEGAALLPSEPEADRSPAPKPSASPADLAQGLPGESAIMARLRAIGQSDPELSLELAREGNRRFPGSADAPERAWFVVKSLANLQRFEEAKSEARVMVDTYKDTPWALDVERHLLVNPLTHPSERGYGRQLELE